MEEELPCISRQITQHCIGYTLARSTYVTMLKIYTIYGDGLGRHYEVLRGLPT